MKEIKINLDKIHENIILIDIKSGNIDNKFDNKNYFFYNSLKQQGVISQGYLS
jgi:hypothetical protein